jgi:hypothetical protein
MANGKLLRNVKPRGTERPVYGNIYLITQQEAEHLFLGQLTPATGKDDRPATSSLRYEKTKEAGNLRTIGKGKAKVAEAPSETDWQQAAVYRIVLPTDSTRQTATDGRLLLSITYQGDCARLYADGRLIADNFQYGRPFLYGLWRLPESTTELELRILPLQPGAPVYLPREADRTAGEGVKEIRIASENDLF